MADYDLVVRNGTVATAADATVCDVGIKDGVVATLGKGLGSGVREIDASGKLVLPGGIDSHCHIEQRSSAGVVCADDSMSGRNASDRMSDFDMTPPSAERKPALVRAGSSPFSPANCTCTPFRHVERISRRRSRQSREAAPSLPRRARATARPAARSRDPPRRRRT